ncbi:hypothetical protein GQ44DRAFT_360171 [Phaeosphaeriaceae sp. PMI808]|nr:hypothetical protein GQ44DRAFT_360171 [Phaeosphaeriaceae sp. PMI808]
MYRRYNELRGIDGHAYPPIEQTLSLLAPRAKTLEQLDRLHAFFRLNFDARINLTPSYDSSLEVAMIDTAISVIEGTCSLDLFEVIPRAVSYTIKNLKSRPGRQIFEASPSSSHSSDQKLTFGNLPNHSPIYILYSSRLKLHIIEGRFTALVKKSGQYSLTDLFSIVLTLRLVLYHLEKPLRRTSTHC